MELRRFGTPYGGYWCYPELVPRGQKCYILDLGVGEDVSFTEELLMSIYVHSNIFLEDDIIPVFIDPTMGTAKFFKDYSWPFEHDYIFHNYAVSDKASVVMYANRRGEASDSVSPAHSAVWTTNVYEVQGITLAQLVEQYDPVSLIKMDIEGAEYDVIKEMPIVPQVVLELHSFCIAGLQSDEDLRVIRTMYEKGYELKHVEKSTLLFVHEDEL